MWLAMHARPSRCTDGRKKRGVVSSQSPLHRPLSSRMAAGYTGFEPWPVDRGALRRGPRASLGRDAPRWRLGSPPTGGLSANVGRRAKPPLRDEGEAASGALVAEASDLRGLGIHAHAAGVGVDDDEVAGVHPR